MYTVVTAPLSSLSYCSLSLTNLQYVTFRYVRSRLRRWKMWVTTFNQGTSLLLILTRLLAEQARASDDTGGGVDGFNNGTSTTEERPAIFDASLAFMYVAKVKKRRTNVGARCSLRFIWRTITPVHSSSAYTYLSRHHPFFPPRMSCFPEPRTLSLSHSPLLPTFPFQGTSPPSSFSSSSSCWATRSSGPSAKAP